MNQVHVNPDRLDEVAQMFKKASNDSSQMLAHLTQSLHTLEGDWRGQAATRFFQEFGQWQTTTRQFVELLDAVGGQLKQVSDYYRAADGVH